MRRTFRRRGLTWYIRFGNLSTIVELRSPIVIANTEFVP